jgi:P27 family predicted phage terminase small subunit
MGRRGPHPRPTALEEKLGNPGKKKKNRAEPKPEPISTTAPPDFLDAVAQKEWKRIAPLLKDLGLLTKVDTVALAAYCQAFSDFVSASKVLAKGTMFTTPNGYVQPRPEVGIKRTAASQILRFCQEFGMTPSSRARMVVDVKPAAASRKKKLEDLLA